MQYRRLGKSDLEVSVIGFGAWQLADDAYWGEAPDADPDAAVGRAIDGGINFFDTAEGYADGRAEEVLGKALGARRKDVILATKVSPQNCTQEAIRTACEASLVRLGTDYIDLYQIHWPFRTEPFDDAVGNTARGQDSFEDAQATLEALRDEGKIRHVGVSNFGVGDLSAWRVTGEIASDQLAYNLLFRAVEYEIAPYCREHNVGMICYMPLMQGLLSGSYTNVEDIPVQRRRTRHFSSKRHGVRHDERGCEPLLMETVVELRAWSEAVGVPATVVSLCWLVRQPGVSTAIVGLRKPAHLDDALRAGDLDLGPAAMAQLNEISYALKRQMGNNADLWQSGPRGRVV